MTSDRPTGQRFSQIYLVPVELLSDSQRMRRRLATLIFRHAGNVRDTLNEELGTALISYRSASADYWPETYSKMALCDVLDSITVVANEAYDKGEFLKSVNKIFNEQHMCYEVDDNGGVHFRVDLEFERARTSAIGALSGARYEGVRDQFEKAHRALDGIPPDGKQALRSAFFALEGLFRLIFPNAHQLSGGEVNKYLKPAIDQTVIEKPALHVAQKQVEALKDWIDGAHFYRHEPGTEEPAQPPLDIAVLMVSQAAGYLRWLRRFDSIH